MFSFEIIPELSLILTKSQEYDQVQIYRYTVINTCLHVLKGPAGTSGTFCRHEKTSPVVLDIYIYILDIYVLPLVFVEIKFIASDFNRVLHHPKSSLNRNLSILRPSLIIALLEHLIGIKFQPSNPNLLEIKMFRKNLGTNTAKNLS